jgi:hypothetical protein
LGLLAICMSLVVWQQPVERALAQPGYMTNCGFDGYLGPTDDGSTGPVTLPFTVRFGGVFRNQVYINNNGNLTFGGPLRAYTPFELSHSNRPIIAPFFADVDTRSIASNDVRYGSATFDGRKAFCVDWFSNGKRALGVGYFNRHFDKENYFQLILVERPSKFPGRFDIIFNYSGIEWESGNSSGGVNGLGGICARAGYSDAIGSWREIPGSGECGELLDVAPATGLPNTGTGLIYTSNIGIPGRWVFHRLARPRSLSWRPAEPFRGFLKALVLIRFHT